MGKKNQGEDPLKKLITEAGSEIPGKDFSTNILKMIAMEQAVNADLKRVISEYTFEKVSPQFQANVMQRIEEEAGRKEAPIVPKPLWFGLAACLGLCIVLSFSLAESPFPLLTGLLKSITLPDAPIRPGVEIFAFAITGLAGLTLIDLFLRQKSAVNKLAEP